MTDRIVVQRNPAEALPANSRTEEGMQPYWFSIFLGAHAQDAKLPAFRSTVLLVASACFPGSGVGNTHHTKCELEAAKQ